MSLINPTQNRTSAILFCQEFIAAPLERRYVFGANEYSRAISNKIAVAGIIDDFILDDSFYGIPIIRTEQVPTNALVVASLLGRPLTARAVLNKLGLRHLDFFSFYNYSNLFTESVRFWGDGKQDIDTHTDEYEKIYRRFRDDESKEIFKKIVNFRVTADIDYLNGFVDRQHQQYFEPFLMLKRAGEVFVDIGGYCGETTRLFSDHCPEYEAVYLLEPDKENLKKAQSNLIDLPRIHFLPYGASDKPGIARFQSSGSVSSVDEQGSEEIELDSIDNLIQDPVSFIKMDIEGLEAQAIRGAKRTILQHHPILAISVYHYSSDLRTLPNLILSIQNDYELFIRHYTEGVVETVMFFVPPARLNR